MPSVLFEHPSFGSLEVTTGANQIEWAYALNTQTYDTYGGEVVQILSCYIDDLTVSGEIKTYEKMEEIYSKFLAFVQAATQGNSGSGSFDTTPVTMYYPARGWSLEIIPKSLPGMRYGRDVVVPAWQMVAAVIEPDPGLQAMTAEAVQTLGLANFGKLTASIGYEEENPFSDPAAHGKGFDPVDTDQAFNQLGDHYDKIIKSYANGNFDELTAGFGSYPAFLTRNHPDTTAGTKKEQGKVHHHKKQTKQPTQPSPPGKKRIPAHPNRPNAGGG